MRRTSTLALTLLIAGCASTGTPGDKIGNLTCLAAQIKLQECAGRSEKDTDACRYAETVARVCEAAESPSLLASNPGAGYKPNSLATFWRDFPGGPVRRGIGDLSADAWGLACQGKSGGALAACLRSRFIIATPEVCAEYRRLFGVTTCGTPDGGWALGPSNERVGVAIAALNYFCENDPSVIGSTGRAGGWDCASTGQEWAMLGAFAGERIAQEWQRRTQGPAVPVCPNGVKEIGETCATCPQDVPNCPFCGNGRVDPGETCQNCPADLGACPPPPDGKLDCSGLAVPPPDAPQWVAVAPRGSSTGSVDVAEMECRGATALPPAQVPPAAPACIPAEVLSTATACSTWTAVKWQKDRCGKLLAWAKGLPAC